MDSLRFPRPVTHSLGIFVAITCFLTLSADAANSVMANIDFVDDRGEGFKVFEYEKNLVIQCNITETSGKLFVLRWFKEDKEIHNTEDKYKIINDENKLVIYRAVETDVGNYTCQAMDAKTNATEKAAIHVIGSPKISLPEDTPVVEGETLKLHCSVRGYPTPEVFWTISNKTVSTSDSRISYKDDAEVKNAYLIIENVQMSDRNHYTCTAHNKAIRDNKQPHKTTFVRVKDKLAALWPFLGICAEVAILCTIILIYEKKRNKTELDESDTDQSPEQKNTPDHGKDVRQRK